jgi:hypothetical protein
VTNAGIAFRRAAERKCDERDRPQDHHVMLLIVVLLIIWQFLGSL